MNPSPPPIHLPPADDEHLRLLVIFHYVAAGLALAGLVALAVHFAVMATYFPHFAEPRGPHPAPPPALLALVPVFYALAGLFSLAVMVGNFLSARWIAARRNRTFSLVVAGLNCLQVPLGLLLGIFTFIVLLRPSVREAYAAGPA